MSDLIDRDFIKSLGGKCIAYRDEKTNELFPIIGIDALPSAQPTLYGYNIEHLVFIAKAMEKDGLSPEEVANLLRDTGYAVKFVIESLKEALKKINHSE